MTAGPAGAQIGFGRQSLAHLVRAIRNFGSSHVRGPAIGFASLLVLLLFAINALNVVNSYVGRDFMTAVEHRDWNAFVWEGGLYVGVFVLLTVTAVFYSFAEQRLGLLWREYITRRAVTGYLDGRLYYHLSVAGTLTNPDQRIADDVRTFTTSTLSLMLIFVNGVLTTIAFSGVLWSISRLLFVVAVVYAAVGSVLAVSLGRPLVRLNYDQSDKEANFRADLIHIREHTESIALSQREPQLRARLLRRIEAYVGNMKHIIAVNRNLAFFTTGYNYMIQLIPALIVAPLFIGGTVEFGVISQSAVAFAHVVGAFSLVITQFPSLSSYAAVLARLAPIAGWATMTGAEPAGGIAIVEDDARLAVEAVTLRSRRDGTDLVRALTVDLAPRGRLLVTSASEHVTNALQQAIAGLWDDGEGRIVRPPLDHIGFLPERPYLPPGTLRQLFSGERHVASDEEISQALGTAGAGRAVERAGGLDVECDWDTALSLEEQRLVSLTHVLIAAPRFVVVSHLGEGLGGTAGVGRVLDALRNRGIGCVALGDGALPHESFDRVIDIGADGSWTDSVAKAVAR
jgi:vitamin B12/bleomycin/antimicrobial peptide transport system ATP-binding/permease protein